MNKDEFHPFDGQFEPQAEAVAKGNPYIPLPEIAQASIAISLNWPVFWIVGLVIVVGEVVWRALR